MSDVCLPLGKVPSHAVVGSEVLGGKGSAQPERGAGLAALSSPVREWRS